MWFSLQGMVLDAAFTAFALSPLGRLTRSCVNIGVVSVLCVERLVLLGFPCCDNIVAVTAEGGCLVGYNCAGFVCSAFVLGVGVIELAQGSKTLNCTSKGSRSLWVESAYLEGREGGRGVCAIPFIMRG